MILDNLQATNLPAAIRDDVVIEFDPVTVTIPANGSQDVTMTVTALGSLTGAEGPFELKVTGDLCE
jgi:hypothetical protein